MIILYQCYDDLDGHEITMMIMADGREESLSGIRPCRMDVPPSGALDMNKSLHQNTGYILKGD